MGKVLQVDIVSAEQQIFSGEATMVIAPGESGELGILPEHMPLLTRIKPGTVRILPVGGGEDDLRARDHALRRLATVHQRFQRQSLRRRQHHGLGGLPHATQDSRVSRYCKPIYVTLH